MLSPVAIQINAGGNNKQLRDCKSRRTGKLNKALNTITIIIIVAFLLVAAILRSRRANQEQRLQEMHPSNYRKPKTERVEKS